SRVRSLTSNPTMSIASRSSSSQTQSGARSRASMRTSTRAPSRDWYCSTASLPTRILSRYSRTLTLRISTPRLSLTGSQRTPSAPRAEAWHVSSSPLTGARRVSPGRTSRRSSRTPTGLPSLDRMGRDRGLRLSGMTLTPLQRSLRGCRLVAGGRNSRRP
ncbi:hypothetical protein COL922a_014407, partial [Colletotrichum nupharicola]